MQLSIQITGTKDVQRKLRRLGPELTNLKGSMSEIGREAARYYSNQGFNSQGGVFGKAWTPLKRATTLRKARKYPGRPPLVATGKMRDGFTFTAGSNQVLIGNKVDYFKYHQSTAPRQKIPRRAMMGINAPIKQLVRTVIEAEIRKKIRTA